MHHTPPSTKWRPTLVLAPWLMLAVACDDAASPPAATAPPPSDAAALAPEGGPLGSSPTPSDGGADVALGVQFLNLRVEEVGSRRAVVRFDTSVPTTCEVLWGLTAASLDRAASDPDMDPANPYALAHEVPLEDLPPATPIAFRAKATTPGGETFLSELRTFTTAAAAPGEPAWVNVGDLASGASIAAVSSNFGNTGPEGSFGANNAIDGMMATEWSSQGEGNAASLTVDLGANKTLVGFGFRSRKMSDGTSIIKALKLTFDGAAQAGPYLTPDPDNFYKFAFKAPQGARLVKLEAVDTTGGNTGIKEFQLFATP
ncbi:MAG: discoidin domain-containing protein [Myxococcales bacterium]|nr:discoidin domain-containing protein [Myxococcales bacterium]